MNDPHKQWEWEAGLDTAHFGNGLTEADYCRICEEEPAVTADGLCDPCQGIKEALADEQQEHKEAKKKVETAIFRLSGLRNFLTERRK